MSDVHQQFFKLYLMEQDSYPLSPDQREALRAHFSGCAVCRVDRRIDRELRAQARVRWPATGSALAVEEILHGTQSRGRLRWASLPLRTLAWAGLALLVLVLVLFVFTNLRPLPAAVPVVLPTPARPTPTGTPTSVVSEEGKIPLQPLPQNALLPQRAVGRGDRQQRRRDQRPNGAEREGDLSPR